MCSSDLGPAPTELVITDLVVGDGAEAVPGARVQVHYVGVDFETGEQFDAVAALEVIEHVADPASFTAQLAELLVPGGLLFLSTLNRTAKSFLTAKLGAEYVLRLLPVGTHDWRRFLTPAEVSGHLRAAGLRVSAITGLSADPQIGRAHV